MYFPKEILEFGIDYTFGKEYHLLNNVSGFIIVAIHSLTRDIVIVRHFQYEILVISNTFK